jgi:hypothetical protein
MGYFYRDDDDMRQGSSTAKKASLDAVGRCVFSLILCGDCLTTLFSIQKKFKWAGEMWTHTTKEHASRLCDVQIFDATDPVQGGIRFAFLLSKTVASIKLQKTMPRHVFERIFLPALTKPMQFARLGSEHPEDREAILALVKYMEPRELVSFICPHKQCRDDNIAGDICIFRDQQ